MACIALRRSVTSVMNPCHNTLPFGLGLGCRVAEHPTLAAIRQTHSVSSSRQCVSCAADFATPSRTRMTSSGCRALSTPVASSRTAFRRHTVDLPNTLACIRKMRGAVGTQPVLIEHSRQLQSHFLQSAEQFVARPSCSPFPRSVTSVHVSP